MPHPWEPLVAGLTADLEAAGIPYTVDAGFAMLLQGVAAYTPDDVDISVEWGSLDRARTLLARHIPEAIKQFDGWAKFRVVIDGVPIDMLSYQGSVMAADPERVAVACDGQMVWCKSLRFFGQHLPTSDPRRAEIAALLAI